MRRSSRRIALAMLAAPVALAAPRVALAATGAAPVVVGLDQPVAFTFDPSGRIWYVEKTTGAVRVHDPTDGTDRPFVTVRGVNGDGERGMLGIALHPRYPRKPLVYVYATRSVSGRLRNQVLRYREEDGVGVRLRVLLSSRASASPYHNGGRILFGPDGFLYVVTGDGHDPATAQDLSGELRGQILRIAPNGAVPRTNPFGDPVFAYGLRNSFGFAFDPRSGRLWQTENGPACNDEINLIRRGRSHGWGPRASCDGASPGNTNRDGPNPVRPKDFYAVPIGITGIAFCEGCRLGRRSEGAAFWGSVNQGTVTRARLNARRNDIARRTTVYRHAQGTLSFEVGRDGRIYFSDFGGIYVLRRG